MTRAGDNPQEGRRGSGGAARVLIRDTMSGQRLEPAERGRKDPVLIYLCGVTVYDDAHIGHARTIITFDVLRRYLDSIGVAAKMIQNFTDVDDKIIVRARAEEVTAAELSGKYIDRYHDEFDRLNVLRADSYPKATEHIPQIISFVSDLVAGGRAYASKNGVYFAVSEFAGYGKLSKKRVDELRSGARVEIDEQKNDPLDFALWKFDDGDPSWESPWGRGRPGWHIECSAMSTSYLGDCIDIHGGGRDLIFPHHENEIAQSESRTGGGRFARIWMHVGMVTICGEKMSKSLGNTRTVRQALEDWGPNVIRIFCLSGHYSKPIDYSEENLKECLARWRQLEACASELGHAVSGPGVDGHDGGDGPASDKPTDGTASGVDTMGDVGDGDADDVSVLIDAQERFDRALGDDLNTHMALLALMDVVSETNIRIAGSSLGSVWASRAMRTVCSMSGVLGLVFCTVDGDERRSIHKMVSERDSLRKDGMYADADRIRNDLALRGIEIIDRAGGTAWIKREDIGMDRRQCGQ